MTLFASVILVPYLTKCLKNEEKAVHGGADYLRLAAGGIGYARQGDYPETGYHRGDLLLVEEEVRWPGHR